MAATKKNYQYLALQLRQQLVRAEARQLHQAFGQLLKETFPDSDDSDIDEPEPDRHNRELHGESEYGISGLNHQDLQPGFPLELGPSASALLPGQWQVGGSSSSRASPPISAREGSHSRPDLGFDKEAFEMGFQVLSDLAAARTRVGLRTWSTFARRAKLQDLNSTVLQVLRLGQARPGPNVGDRQEAAARPHNDAPPTPTSMHSPAAPLTTGRPHPDRLDSASNTGTEARAHPPISSAASTPLAFVQPQQSPGSATSQSNAAFSPIGGRPEGLANVIASEVLNPSMFPNSPSAMSASSPMGVLAGAIGGAQSPGRSHGLLQPPAAPSIGSVAHAASEASTSHLPANRHSDASLREQLAAAGVEAGAGPAPPVRSRVELLEERLQALQQELQAERQANLATAASTSAAALASAFAHQEENGPSVGVSAASLAGVPPPPAQQEEDGPSVLGEAASALMASSANLPTGSGAAGPGGDGGSGSGSVAAMAGVSRQDGSGAAVLAAATFAEGGSSIEAFGDRSESQPPQQARPREGTAAGVMAARAAVEEVLWGSQNTRLNSQHVGRVPPELDGSHISRRLGDLRRPPGPAEANPHQHRAGAVFQPNLQAHRLDGYSDGNNIVTAGDDNNNNDNNDNGDPGAFVGSSMDDFVKELRGDQAKVDEVVQLASLLWEIGILRGKPTLPERLKACLLLRLAQRLEQALLKESLQQWWHGSAVRRSLEELWSRNPTQAARLAGQAVPQQTSPPLQGSHPVTPSAIAFGIDSVSPPQSQRNGLGRPGPWHGGRYLELHDSPQRSARLNRVQELEAGGPGGAAATAATSRRKEDDTITARSEVLVLGDAVEIPLDASGQLPTVGADARFASALGWDAGNPTLPRPTVNERLQDVQADASEERAHLERELAAVQQQQEESTAAALALRDSEERARTSESAAFEEIANLRAQLFRAEALVAEAASDAQHADEHHREATTRSMGVIQDAAAATPTPGAAGGSSSHHLRGHRAEAAVERLALVGRAEADEGDADGGNEEERFDTDDVRPSRSQNSAGGADRRPSDAAITGGDVLAAAAVAALEVGEAKVAAATGQVDPPTLATSTIQRRPVDSPGTPDESDDDDGDSLPLDFDEGPSPPSHQSLGRNRQEDSSDHVLPRSTATAAVAQTAAPTAGPSPPSHATTTLERVSSSRAQVGRDTGLSSGRALASDPYPATSSSVPAAASAATASSTAAPAPSQGLKISKLDIADVLGSLSGATDDDDDDGASIDDDDLADLLK